MIVVVCDSKQAVGSKSTVIPLDRESFDFSLADALFASLGFKEKIRAT